MAGTREDSLEETQLGLRLEGRVLRMEVHYGVLLPDFQSSGLEFPRKSFKAMRWFPLRPHQWNNFQDQEGMG